MEVNAIKDAIKVLIDRYIKLNESLYKELLKYKKDSPKFNLTLGQIASIQCFLIELDVLNSMLK